MSITVYLPTGVTEPREFQALDDDVATNKTGMTPTMEAIDKHGRKVTITGAVAFSDAVNAKWTYTPDGQLVPALSPYLVRLSVNDGTSIVKYPEGEKPDLWWVVP